MAGMITDLIDMLNKQAQTYEELHGLALEKKDAIVKDDIAEIEKITDLENILVSQHHRIEKKRDELVADIAIVLNHKGKTLDLPTLIERMEGQSEQEQLKQVRVRMRTALDKLSEANELNTILVQDALDHIEYLHNVIHSTMKQEVATYMVQGGKLRENDGILDIRN